MGVKVRERKGTWWLFIDHKSKRKAKKVGPGPNGKKAAERAATEIAARLALGDVSALNPSPRQAPSFREAADRWLAAHAQSEQIRPSTHEEYARTLRLYAYPHFGAKPAIEVTRSDIRDLVVEITAQGKSRSVARNLLAPVRQTFNQLIDDGLMSNNPAARMGRYLKEQRDRRSGLDLLTPEEEEVLLTAVLEHCPRYYCLLLCALRTGLRIGELFGLQWDDLDFAGRFVEVRRTLKDGKRVFPPKNGRIRRVDMSLQLVEELKRQRVHQSREALANGWGRVPWVFTDSQSNPLRKNNFGRRVFQKLLRKAGLRSIKFHTLRHTFASRLLQNRESPVYVKDQLGHASIKITVDTYGHLIPGANKAAVDRLDVTGRNPTATEPRTAKDDASVSS